MLRFRGMVWLVELVGVAAKRGGGGGRNHHLITRLHSECTALAAENHSSIASACLF